MKIAKYQIKSIALIILATFIFAACEYSVIEVAPPELPDEEISFQTHILPIFENKCASCHISRAPILSSDNAYNSLVSGNFINLESPEESPIYTKVLAGHPGGNQTTTATENALILKWIQEGAKNN